MSKLKLKCIIILSAKSSGSTALQKLLTKFTQVNHIEKTRHFEYETLFWTKAASILQMPQVDMLDSEVPLNKEKAKFDLIYLLTQNINSYTPPDSDYELIFDGWKLLCRRYSPVFVEKSPHHLHQWSAIELINQAITKISDVDFFLIGIVRNPMAMLYSSWDRMRTVPEKNQYEWFTAYTNLLKLQEIVKDKLIVIKYEEMVKDLSCLDKVFKFIGDENNQMRSGYLHQKSIDKWNNDRFYGFQLSDEVFKLAKKFGYTEYELANNSSIFWPLYRVMPKRMYRVMRRIKRGLS